MYSHVFIDETGTADRTEIPQPFFGVGMLKINDTSHIADRLLQECFGSTGGFREKRRQLLQELGINPRVITREEIIMLMASTHHYELKFSSIANNNLDAYKRFIDILLPHPFHFCAIIIDKTDPLFNQRVYGNYWDAYIKYSQLLLTKNCKADERVSIIADYMSKPSFSEDFFEEKMKICPNVVTAIRAHSIAFPFLQITDLLLGCVNFQLKDSRGLIASSRRSAAKREFVEHVLSKMIIPFSKQNSHPLAQNITIHNPSYFSVWMFRLS